MSRGLVPKLIFVLAVMLALAISLLADQSTEAFPTLGSIRSHFLQGRLPTLTTCNKYPRICRAKGSPGPDCCRRRCVNVSSDRLNCGKCGNKCKYSEICCKGKCVNPWTNKKYCGGCNNKCRKGNKCVFGMCNYA